MNTHALQHCALFAHITPDDLTALLVTLRPITQTYRKGDVLLWAGDASHRLGVIAQGAIRASKPMADGSDFPITQMATGGVFGDVLSASDDTKSPVTLRALCQTTVLWFPYHLLLSAPDAPRTAHTQLLKNLVSLLAQKYFALDRRIEVLLLHSVRSKILHYLKKEVPCDPDGWRTITLTRTALATYLGCERSALSRELSRMEHDGILCIDKKRFLLLPQKDITTTHLVP